MTFVYWSKGVVMKKTYLIVLLAILFLSSCSLGATVKLSRDVFNKVPFSNQYSEDGALIMNIDYKSVNDLKLLIESQFKGLIQNKKLKDRGEAHITLITPPEGRTGFFPNSVGIDKVLPTDLMLDMYKNTVQDMEFDILCLGMQSNSKGNIVFFLVVESYEVMGLREEIESYVQNRDLTIPFRAKGSYYPHITVGYVGGDVHGVSKGKDSCVADVDFY